MRNRHSPEIWILLLLAAAIAVLTPSIGKSQQTADHVSIKVHFNQSEGPLRPIWNYFGYDEPNYTYAPNGKKLLGELAALHAAPVYVRVHNLLTSGDGSASLKWGSTNVYAEDASGHPIYSWEILDHIFDTFHSTGIKPLVEIGFMPEALSTHPRPYRHNFPHTSSAGIYTGWAYPPKDYKKTSSASDLPRPWFTHSRSSNSAGQQIEVSNHCSNPSVVSARSNALW
jgi:xylan 1,4-beta-xylosidase